MVTKPKSRIEKFPQRRNVVRELECDESVENFDMALKSCDQARVG